jgi:DNA-binding CsgD family transcriptional regulator
LESLYKLILEIYRAAKETPVDEFQQQALELLGAQTSFDSAHWGCGENTANGVVAHSVYLHHESPEILQEWGTRNQKNSLIVDTVVARSGQSFIYNSPQLFNDDAPMLDYMLRYGHQNNMSITTVSASQPNGQWLSLYRAGKHDHFCRKDALVLEQIMPHLVEALEINRMLGRVNDSGQRGIRALMRKDGTLCHCGSGFARFIRVMWPNWNSGRLPAELLLVIAPKKEVLFAGHLIAATELGDLLSLNIRKTSILHRLTLREIEVARLYGQGISYKEIGVRLDVSPATVRNFVAHIYTKLAINNKVALIELLAAE